MAEPEPATVIAPAAPTIPPTTMPFPETEPAFATARVPYPAQPTCMYPATVSFEPFPLTPAAPEPPAVLAIESPLLAATVWANTPPKLMVRFPEPPAPMAAYPLTVKVEPAPLMLTDPVAPACWPTATAAVVSVPAE